MSKAVTCTLCDTRALFFCQFREKNYYHCIGCYSILLDPAEYLSPADEKERYDEHNNDVDDPGYRQFVKPLVDKVLQKYGSEAIGLDYGAGPGPVSAVLLRERGLKIELYDPFYWNEQAVFDKKYDFIICCEVIEHFQAPAKEFKLLRSLLKPNGSLYCMTEIYTDGLDFSCWHYKNDPTHVFFYHRQALVWIKNECGFAKLTTDKRLIHLEL